ncbi:MAG: sigma-70 family RNA polymerase sigma factor [Acidobacteriota bacterium]
MSETAPSETFKSYVTQEAFDKFLASLDPDRDTAGERYEKIRCKLIRFFEWRGCPSPEEYADETLNRLVRKIGEGEVIRDIHSYCYGVARLVLLEAFKQREKEKAALGDLPDRQLDSIETDEVERQVECLRRCLDKLPAGQQECILGYYQGEKGERIESRKHLSDRLGIPLNALRIKAHRIREALAVCVEDCLGREKS